jgi:hypothetical protein
MLSQKKFDIGIWVRIGFVGVGCSNLERKLNRFI